MDKLDSRLIDVGSASEKPSVEGSDFVLISDNTTGNTMKLPLQSIIDSSSAQGVQIIGEADLDDPQTTLTSIVVKGSSLNPTIQQGVAPNPNKNGIGFIVTTAVPKQSEITGVSVTLKQGDQVIWIGDKWAAIIIDVGVYSVNGKKGVVTINASDVNAYSKTESDSKYATKTELSSKLGKTETAADSALLEGKTKSEVVAEARVGLASQSSVTALEDEITTKLDSDGKALDSFKLEGSSKAQVVSEARTGMLTTTGTAANSSKLEGSTKAQVVEEARSGNCATATKLATSRTINGTGFDGTANITTTNWGTARTLTIGNSGKSVNGSVNVSWSLSEIGALSSSDNSIWKNRGGITNFNTNSAVLPGYFSYSPNATGAPTTGYGHGFIACNGSAAGSGVWGTQFAFEHGSGAYYRNFINGLPSGGWVKFYTTANKPTAADVGALTQSAADSRYLLKTANAVSASKLATSRTISLTGNVTGSASFDGSSNVSISTAIPSSTTSVKGIVQLTSAVNSTSETLAASARGVKIAYDRANAAYSLAQSSAGRYVLTCNGVSSDTTIAWDYRSRQSSDLSENYIDFYLTGGDNPTQIYSQSGGTFLVEVSARCATSANRTVTMKISTSKDYGMSWTDIPYCSVQATSTSASPADLTLRRVISLSRDQIIEIRTVGTDSSAGTPSIKIEYLGS